VAQFLQVAQRAADLNRARDFYRRLLQAEPTGFFDPPGLLFFQVGPTRLLLEREAPSALLYLAVPDVRQVIEQCRADGVEIISEPHVIFTHTDDSLGPAGTDEWMAFIKDSEGNTLGLVSHRPAAGSEDQPEGL
jgi:methylmalonyl-CoA/ethylmalonyl-CoA epimerase